MLFSEVFNGTEPIHAGVVNENVEMAVVFDGRVDESVRLSGLRNIAFDRNGFTA